MATDYSKLPRKEKAPRTMGQNISKNGINTTGKHWFPRAAKPDCGTLSRNGKFEMREVLSLECLWESKFHLPGLFHGEGLDKGGLPPYGCWHRCFRKNKFTFITCGDRLGVNVK